MQLYTVAVEYNQSQTWYYFGINYHAKIMVHLGTFLFLSVSIDYHIIK